eukprot:TRINITY_DN23787_c0_g1_i2.p1 TRINITY_DN23787_c0_g1~~TRINITY_DN23787_c0_g1_i2.p1  ORF type:complete len:299 (+),score=88.37 TRINITY_DN23787_c0_g1_i2:243-1139(+)
MRFIPLDLDNFTAISQQVDDVILKFKELALQGPEHVEELQDAIQDRLLDLENFYYENDLDERAILFEKQRLKLRKMLRDYETGRLHLGEPVTEAPRPVNSGPSRGTATRRAPRAAKNVKSTPQLVHSSAVKERKLRVAPIYDWEIRSNNRNATEEEEAERADVAPDGFEFQVKLTKDEFDTLMERRATQTARGRSFLHKGQGKNMSSVIKRPSHDEDDGRFVTSQGPYIEPTYFENWRDTNKGKWVDKNDFKRNGLQEKPKAPFDKKLQLDNFLHQGPYVEGSFNTVLRGEDLSLIHI